MYVVNVTVGFGRQGLIRYEPSISRAYAKPFHIFETWLQAN
jgi:hypothetical protein